MSIITATVNDAEMIAGIISSSNKNVAKEFGLTRENNPKHPSFCTKDWILSDFDRGVEYFIFREGKANIGCVAYESTRHNTAYLNRLSVLPDHRRCGVGGMLVKHIVEHAKSKDVKRISIGIITEHTALKHWYLKLGFAEGETKNFSHLPFDVTYMSYMI